MTERERHLSNEELVLAADGEGSAGGLAHYAACAACRERARAFDRAAAIYAESLEGAPGAPRRTAPLWAAAVAAGAALALVGWGLFPVPAGGPSARAALPNPVLTPGAAGPWTAQQLCAGGGAPEAQPPRALARRVFAAYGIPKPKPRAFEMDMLIAPELGGSLEARNLWPQPYGGGPWNARAKDALEDRLFELVCAGEIGLVQAQREIAEDWIASYRRRFATDDPLVVHMAFLKDEPWE